MTNLYQQWRDIAEAERTQEAGEKFWNDYFEAETENYKKLLADHEKVYSGKISELAPMFNMDEPTFVGFIDRDRFGYAGKRQRCYAGHRL